MHIKILDRPIAHVAYLRHTGPYGLSVASFWQDVYVPWAIASQLGPSHARYGISHDDPSSTAPEQCRYDACAAVSADYVPGGMALKASIPGGQYAVLAFKGTSVQIGSAWAALLHDWLPASDMRLDSRPCFEYYSSEAGHDSNTREFECELCIPITPR
jgi:AraC family transcriptional regulator